MLGAIWVLGSQTLDGARSCAFASVGSTNQSTHHACSPNGHDRNHLRNCSGSAPGSRHKLEVEPRREDEDHSIVAGSTHEPHDTEEVWVPMAQISSATQPMVVARTWDGDGGSREGMHDRVGFSRKR